ncbi:MAG: S41 family peptidase [Pyrinomonadaceae bacterium]|nr:S41 family peptidase [Pyrinomonadaceae bacterium]
MNFSGVDVNISRTRKLIFLVAFGLVGLVVAPQSLHGQGFDQIERGRALSMLSIVKSDLKNNYYDPNFRGMDVEARFKTAEEKVKQATSLSQAFGIIAQTLLDLNDSHTKFFPPSRPESINYGWRMQMIGDKCYVVAVKPDSDAEAKGLKEGDLLLALERFKPTRRDLWKMRYYYSALSPRPALRVLVQSPGGEPRDLELKAKIKHGQVVRNLTTDIEINDYIREIEDDFRNRRHRYYENVGGAFVWNMPAFDLSESAIDEMMDKASKRGALVLDLRGNGGGAEVTLLRLIGQFFDKDLKVADVKERKQTKPLIAKTRGRSTYSGKLVILIDSESGSSSELFARVMQMEKRGVVVGDLSAGAVMRARVYPHDLGANTLVSFGVGITNADAIMTDGRSLENVGVTPDELLLPSGEDMAAKRDTVLAHALKLVGVTMTPEKAGALFPIIWEK